MEGPFGVRRDLAGGLNIVTARLGYLGTLGGRWAYRCSASGNS